MLKKIVITEEHELAQYLVVVYQFSLDGKVVMEYLLSLTDSIMPRTLVYHSFASILKQYESYTGNHFNFLEITCKATRKRNIYITVC